MDIINGVDKNELSREISKDGATLIVTAKKISDGEWELAILNEKGVSSNWLELFSTAEQAIDAGIAAIEKEGIKEFVDVEGFEYLNE